MKIRSRYKTYPIDQIREAFYSDTPFENEAWYPTKMMLEERLDSIWRLGDRDEVSIKHILYSVGAILAGRKWNEQMDYGMEMNKKAKVIRNWGIVESMLDYWGLDIFSRAFYATKFGQTGYGVPLSSRFSYNTNPNMRDDEKEYPPPKENDGTPASEAYFGEREE